MRTDVKRRIDLVKAILLVSNTNKNLTHTHKYRSIRNHDTLAKELKLCGSTSVEMLDRYMTENLDMDMEYRIMRSGEIRFYLNTLTKMNRYIYILNTIGEQALIQRRALIYIEKMGHHTIPENRLVTLLAHYLSTTATDCIRIVDRITKERKATLNSHNRLVNMLHFDSRALIPNLTNLTRE